jgi:hypothetical protein
MVRQALSVGIRQNYGGCIGKRQWCSGNIIAFQAIALSSILGWRKFLFEP